MKASTHSGWCFSHDETILDCPDLSDLIYRVDKALTIELQRRRPELFFVHAAVLRAGSRCIVIVGESGAGKSTLCWDLCNAGLTYMSDELAPIDLDTMEVEAYPRAICLKRIAPQMPALPRSTIQTTYTLHIPVEAIPSGFERERVEIDSVLFIESGDRVANPQLEAMRLPEATARFYANGLNQLAHEHDGLRAAARIAAATKCFSLARGDLRDMQREVIRRLVN